MSLSVCMMVKNEAATLDRVIRSWPYAELIIGVDRASKDASLRIAKKYATHCFEFDWCDDFSKIRNMTLERASKEFIAWPDGHEFLEAKSRPFVESLSQIPDNVDSINCKLSILDQSGEEILYFYQTKILRNGKFHFENRVHNKPTRLFDDGSISAVAQEIRIRHKRPESLETARHQQRKELNLNCHLEALKSDPTNSRELFYLGQGYLERGEFDKGLEALHKHLSVTSWTEEKYQVRFYISTVYLEQGKFEEALEVLWPCEQEDLRRGEHYTLRGDACFNLGRFWEAERWYRTALAVPLPVSPMFILPRFYTWFPHQRLCDLYARMGDRKAAIREAYKLKKYKPKLAQVALDQLTN